jgi:hypothetical protein
VLPPDAVAPVTSERQPRGQSAKSQATRPSFTEIPPLQRPDVSETIVISGILHCDEELEPLRVNQSLQHSKPDEFQRSAR